MATACKAATERQSDRVVDIDEFAGDAELPAEVVGQRLYAVTLGGMVPGGDIRHAALPREMDGLFGNLA